MALQKNYYHKQLNIVINDVYWRINPDYGIEGGKNKISYIIEGYKDSNAAHQEGSLVIDKLNFSFIPDITFGSLNFIEQAYNHAKNQPNLKGSIDV